MQQVLSAAVNVTQVASTNLDENIDRLEKYMSTSRKKWFLIETTGLKTCHIVIYNETKYILLCTETNISAVIAQF